MDQKFEVQLSFKNRPQDPPLALARRIFADLRGCTVMSVFLEPKGAGGHLAVSLQCAAVEKPITRHELRLFVSIVTDRLGENVKLENVRQLGIAKVEHTVSLCMQAPAKRTVVQ